MWDRFDSLLVEAQVPVGASVVALNTLMTFPPNMRGVILCNNSSNTIYLGFSSNVTSSFYAKQIAAGGQWEMLIGHGVANQLEAIASGSSSELYVAVLS